MPTYRGKNNLEESMPKEKEGEKQKEKPKTLKEKAKAFLKEFGIVFGMFLVINNFVVASFLVPTGSMEDEVLTGELLFVNKFIYGGTSPRNVMFTNIRLPWFRLPQLAEVDRGDVIVFVFPGLRDEVEPEDFVFYLKRCVGLPGDTILVKNRILYVNGQVMPFPRNTKFDYPRPLSSGQVEQGIFPRNAEWNQDHYGPLVVPKKGMVIPLNADTVSSWEVFIRREGHSVQVQGNHVLIDGTTTNEYTVARDYLFGMGDHRDNSLDSRYWGFIPRENLVGSPLIVYWSWNSDLPIYDIFGRIASVRWGRIGSLIR